MPAVVLKSTPDWKEQWREALRTATDLAEAGYIPLSQIPAYDELLKVFPVVLPRYYANLIEPGDPYCPIRLQAIPQLQELTHGGSSDPLEDLQHQPVPRITHRYTNRALLHLTPNCSMVCRYCFRKSLLSEHRQDFVSGDLQPALKYLEETPAVEEVIFSGGDPFLANESVLKETLEVLSGFRHLKRVRFHTRVPVTLPMRVNPGFARLLTESQRPTVVVTHFNHPKECTREAQNAADTLKAAGLTVFNQSVLLKGVNNSVEALCELSETLFSWGIIPYYLHHPDPARGTAHFDLTHQEGLTIHNEMRRRLPGYLVPRYVQDDPRSPYKVPVVFQA